MFAAGAPRIPAAGPAANGIATQAPAGIAADGGSADSSSKPFAALLMGFLQGAQPAAPTVAAPTASENSASADDLLLPDASTDGTELLAIPAVAVPGQQALTAKSTAASSGTTSPASGNRLPPELPELPGNPSPTAQVPSQMDSSDAIPTARISLADIEHSRQLNMATSTQALQADAKALAERFMPAANSSLSAMPGTASATDSSGDLLPGAEADGILLQPAGLTAGDLSRLVQNLAQNGGRESFSAAFSTAGKGTGSLSGTVTTTTAENGGLGNMVRSSLGGFPPLQPLGSPQAWTTGLGDRLLTLAGPGTHSARLRLHPESLGTLDIEIKIADSTAQVWFGAQHSQTREAIEASLPQLREMFAEQGIRLAHAQVDSGTDQRTPDQQQGFDEPGTSQNPWHRSSARSSLADTLAPIRQATNRLLDAWA
jgi:flagellar hook-length control protein FliK